MRASRWCRREHRVPLPRGNRAGFVGSVREALRSGRYEVVFGGGDDWVAALATHREEFPARVAHPDADTVAASLDKLELTRRAVDCGFAAPRTVPADGTALARWEGPAVVKCRTHWSPGHEHHQRIEARRFDDPASARDRVEQIRRAGFEPVLQELIRGRLEALTGLFAGGRLRGRVQQVAHGVWPTPSGVSCRARTVPVDERLAEQASVLLAELGWSGLVELQFLTPEDGRRHLIDLNGRFYGSLALANAAGPNLPDAWGRQVLGRPVPELPDARPGVRYLWLGGDLRRARVERRGGLLRDVGSSLSWALFGTTSVWDRRDPSPTVAQIAGRLRRPS